mgnify:CR=1 FL=1
MGSGASSLTNEQKAAITKEMKEKYESIDPADQPTAHENLQKHYEEIVAKFQAGEPSIGLGAGKKLRKAKKKMARLRSFENGQFLLENVAHEKKAKEDPDRK